MENLDEAKYARAKKKMEEIKGFYWHLTIYLVINFVLLILKSGLIRGEFLNMDNIHVSSFGTAFFWGIGLTFHGLHVFQNKFRFLKDWEDRKIKEYMKKDEDEFKRSSEWD